MKLIIQITLSVFLGTLASQLTFNYWQSRQENVTKEAAEKLRAEQERVRLEQGERIRALLMQNRQANPSSVNKPPPGFVPDGIKGP